MDTVEFLRNQQISISTTLAILVMFDYAVCNSDGEDMLIAMTHRFTQSRSTTIRHPPPP